MVDDIVAKVLMKDKHDLLTFINNYLQISHPRDDYKELLEFSLIFLDDTPNHITHFKRPGAMHHARWMAKAIYSLKIFLFRSEFKLTARETKNLREICIFVVLFYIKAWFTSTSAILAPKEDLELMQKLNLYQEQNLPVSLAAIKKLSDHLWYLNEDLAVFALFDKNVSVEIKRQMVESMKSQEETIIIEKRRKEDRNSSEIFLNKNMSDFVSKQSMKLFDKFDLPYDFLDKDVLMWPDNESYKENLDFFEKLKVANDVAERGVALVEEYNRCLTKYEEQFQYLLQVK
ncbi:unnamed protein product [Psylliodes chrysocephalus]|uniref:Uncharacterized protein n=1 Tax=Psylliodes chrysocephalus TaxID=3402493 RepID=A0A9P0D5V8_9CUCU|nr:unnamed protein product [Psylliodes chrysocephala]